MFDVPPPADGVRGIAAYRDTWPPFFGWQAAGASFDIVALDVTAGEDVAYAHALLRCGTEDELRKDRETPATDPRSPQAGRPLGDRPRTSFVPRHELVPRQATVCLSYNGTSGAPPSGGPGRRFAHSGTPCPP